MEGDNSLTLSSELLGSDEDEEEELTSAEVLKRLEFAWQNETLAPDLLVWQRDLVECMIEQITTMEQNIEQATKGDIRISIHKMEIDRIRYILTDYLRCRLKKIETHLSFLLAREDNRQDDEPSRFSPDEYVFAKELDSSVESHLKSAALRHMPKNLQPMNLKDLIHPPNLDHYVFFKVLKPENDIIISKETEDETADKIDFETGAQHLMRFQPIAPLVESASVTLI